MRGRSVSATSRTPTWIGFFDKSGSPAIKVKLGGVFSEGQEFDAILDSGFTGFVSMPLISAFPLGLPLYGTTTVELADGTKASKLTAQVEASVGGESEVGVVILEPSSRDVLLGMAFLRIFKRALFVSTDVVLLIDESRRPDPDEPTPQESTPEGTTQPGQNPG